MDKGSFGIKDVAQTIEARAPARQSGIAQIQFNPSQEDEGFKLMTNDGRNLYYHPLVNKIYNEKELWAGRLTPNARAADSCRRRVSSNIWTATGAKTSPPGLMFTSAAPCI